ncbi:MAG: hypothetical protein JWR84_2261 [Caulobacter sp.]|nr:hypothetical protein [Caulobacter sp.]
MKQSLLEPAVDVAAAASGEALLPITSVEAAAVLDRLQASGAVEQGAVSIISLSAIAEKLGARWASRQERVQDHAERALERQLAGQGVFQRISATDYVVSQPGVSAMAGQATCLNVLRNTLHHFLGAAVMADIRVHTVTRISADGVHGARLDVEAVDRARSVYVDEAPGGSADRWSPFVAVNGQRVRVSCVLEPVILLKTSNRIGYRVARRVLETPSDRPLTAIELTALSRADMQRIDLATIGRGLDRLRSEAEVDRTPSLMLPVSYITLSNLDGRAAVVSLLREAQAIVRHGVICEICDIEGVPAGALATVVSLVRPFCLYVVGRVTGAVSMSGLKDARLQGLTVEFARNLPIEADFVRWAREAMVMAAPLAKPVMLCGLQSPRQMAAAGYLGASHATLRPPERS